MDFIHNAITNFKVDPLGYCFSLCLDIILAAVGIWLVLSVLHWAVNLVTSAV